MKVLTTHRRTALAITACLAMAAGGLATATPATASTAPTLDLRVLLIGEGALDTTTLAWESALTTEGVPYTEVNAAGTAPAQTLALPALSSGTTGYYDGVVIADTPNNFASGQLSALGTYESSFGVNQVDGYMFPDPALGATDVTFGALTSGTLTTAGLSVFPALAGPVPFDTGNYGYGAVITPGAPYTSLITDSAGNTLAGIYQHPGSGSQVGVAELSVYFNYNSSQLQWLLLAPGLVNWVTQGTHLGLYRNYFGQDIDDNFIADNEWSSQYQCTPGATQPSDYTCPAGVANNPADTPPDVQMSAADVAYVVAWEQQTGITLNMLFNAVGACTAPTAAAESSAKCTGSVTDTGGTFTDPGQAVNATSPNDAGLVNALLADRADFNWTNHTWSHQFLGCTAWQPQPLTSATANGTGGTFTAGAYSYEITAATAYGESEPSASRSVTVAAGGSATLTWPEAPNGSPGGPTLAQMEASYRGGTGFWGYNIYRENPGATTYGLVGQVPENTSATSATTYSFTDTGTAAGAVPESSATDPTATDPGIDCSNAAASWDPASSIEQEIGLDQAFAAANGLTNYTPSAVVTGEHSGLENPNMTAAFAATGITTFGADASRQPQAYSLGAALSAPRYPSNIYYNASNWPDELNEYNTLYVDKGVLLGDPTYLTEVGNCTSTTSSTCFSAPLSEAGLLQSESRIMLSHVLNNDPRVGYAHQSNLIGLVTASGQEGYTILGLINDMLSQYNSWYKVPLVQVNDVSDAQTLAEQSAWAAALGAGDVSTTDTNGTVTITNNNSSGTAPINVPVTAPLGTTENGVAFGTSYGGTLSSWVPLAAGQTVTLTQSLAPAITSAASATANVGAAFSFTVGTTGTPAPTLSETGTLPTGLTFTDNGNGTATMAGTPTGTGGLYPLTISAKNSAGTATQSFVLTTTSAPSITSPATATFTSTFAGTYDITTTGYPAPTLTATATTISGPAPSWLSFTDNGNGTGTISGTPTTAGSYTVALKATNASNSTATLNLALTVNAATAPVFGALPVADFVLGAMGSVAITASGFPTPSITETGTLPAGLTFVDNGNGTALLSGTPTAAGTATLTLTAANKVGSNATQSWSVMVGQAPAFTSAGSASASVGSPFSFTVTTSGYPAPWITETAALPAWLTFTANADGTATFSGTPTATDIGQISVGLGASSLAGSTSQTLDLTVAAPAPAPTPAPAPAPAPSPAPIASASPVPPTTTTTVPTAPTTTLPVTRARHTPAFSSAASATATVGHRFSFKVLAVGEPVPALAHSALPKGLSWSSAGNGRATISGVPQVKAAGLTRVSLRASNAAGSATEILVIRVQRRPGLSGGPLPAAAVGRYYHASLSTYGYPRPTVTKSGQLPTGVSLKTARNGEITLSGVPAPSTAGTHHIGITVSNSLGKMTVHFVLTVKRPSA